ncbi:hypothetical protein PMKS-002791 [Pichia membranifaciens]|uniref:Uncharacterized protein n=1 Tax=Pichia membranifaciens TaxID=4926 RepID=A0A1Q2YID4_9ASCO|nr:hypothetical protein PMKS-002791 [Pichia membranifaciens]
MELEVALTGDGGPLGQPEQGRKTNSDDELASEIFGVACGEVLAKGKHGGVVSGLQLQVFGQDVQEGAGRVGTLAGEAGTWREVQSCVCECDPALARDAQSAL